MTQSADAVIALARAYSLSELVPVDDPRVREAVAGAVAALDGALSLTVDGGRMQLRHGAVPDPDGSVREMARDLELAGVLELEVSADVELESLVELVATLRSGADRAVEGPDPFLDERLRGLSRIRAVCDGEAPGVAGRGGSVASLFSDREAETVVAAATRYLEATEQERSERRARLRALAEKASDEGAVDELADAVERLVLAEERESPAGSRARGEAEPHEPLALARELLNPPVAARIALRLGGTRDEVRRRERMDAVARLGAGMAPALGDALTDAADLASRHTYLDALIELGEQARPEVEAMLDDDRWFVIRNGVRILGEIGSEADVQDLISPLGHDDARVRRAAVMALGRIGGEDAALLLPGMVDDPDADVRAGTATALGALGVERAVKPLLKRLEEEEAQNVRVQILRALGALGDPVAVPALEKHAVPRFLSRRPRRIRIAAYRALASIGTPRALDLVEDAAEDGDEEVRREARALLERRGD